ncbi:MAG TPA: DUF6152 family protein [Gammaproteobacteria bacterium]
MKLAQAFAIVGILSGVALSPAPSSAHHSTAAFDTTRVVKIEGEIKQFRWINPHASIKIEGTTEGEDPDGLWTVEMTAPNVLINQGWKRTSVRPGDKVTMFVNPLRNPVELNDGSQGGLYVGVILADGSSLGRVDGKGQGSDQ